MTKHPNLHQLVVLNILSRLSANLQSDLLSDGTVASRYDIPIHRRQQISKGTVLKQETLFNAFESALRGESIPSIVTERNLPIDAKVSVDSDGSGILEVESSRFRFAHMDMLSADPASRVRSLNRYLADRTISTRDMNHLRSVVERREFSHNDFLDVLTTLETSIESFGTQLRTKLETGRIGEADLLPGDTRYWDHLCAPLDGSQSLSDFSNLELFAERTGRLSQDPTKGLWLISLSFSAPALVPIAMLQPLESDVVVGMLEKLLECDDHFALVGAFEICVEWIQKDQRFVRLGEQFLDRLFGDLSRTEAACEIFGTSFVIATAHLARQQRLRGKPPFWRRLVAATHASHVVRISGVTGVSHSELLSWAFAIAGRRYVTSTLLDMHEEPRWRPEWIRPHFLLADAFGRVNIAWGRLASDLAPSSWTSCIEAARTVLSERNIIGLAMFPAITEGVRRPKQPDLAELAAFSDAFQSLSDEPSVQHLLRLAFVIYSVGFPEESLGSIGEVLRRVRNDLSNLKDPATLAVIALCAHIAAQTKNVSLADDVAKTCLEGVRTLKDPESLNQVALRIIECTAADPNRTSAYVSLAKRLENLASSVPSKVMPDLLDILQMLRDIEPLLAVSLGRAVALAQLGMPRSDIN